MRFGRVFKFLYILLFVAVVVPAGVYTYQQFQKLEVLKERERVIEHRLKAIAARNDERARNLASLSESPDFVERTIRAKLNYVRSDEIVFRFE